MRRLATLINRTRQRYHCADLVRYFKGNMDRVTKAQVALDTAEDAMLAISNYKTEGIGSEEGEKYLRLYGFLQAIVLQQDAIAELHRLFVGTFNEPPDESAWRKLRDLRNLTVGHPIDKGLGKAARRRTFITRVSLETDGFDYHVWHQQTGETSFESAHLPTLCAAYRKEASSFLTKILTCLARLPDISC